MLGMVLNIIGMLAVTLLIQFFAYRAKKWMNFWTGTSVVFAICILGVLSSDPSYFGSLLGYLIGDEIGKKAGWHSTES